MCVPMTVTSARALRCRGHVRHYELLATFGRVECARATLVAVGQVLVGRHLQPREVRWPLAGGHGKTSIYTRTTHSRGGFGLSLAGVSRAADKILTAQRRGRKAIIVPDL